MRRAEVLRAPMGLGFGMGYGREGGVSTDPDTVLDMADDAITDMADDAVTDMGD